MTSAEFALETRKYITGFIEFADQKAGAVVALVLAIGAVVALTAPEYFKFLQSGAIGWAVVAALVGCVVLVCSVMCVLSAMDALSPRLDRANQSLASFPDIAALESAEFVRSACALDPAGIARELQIHNSTLARIAHAKVVCLQNSLWWLRLVILAAFGMVIVYVLRLATS